MKTPAPSLFGTRCLCCAYNVYETHARRVSLGDVYSLGPIVICAIKEQEPYNSSMASPASFLVIRDVATPRIRTREIVG